MPTFLRTARAPLALTLLTLVVASCKGDSVVAPGGETEVISRVTLSLTSPTGSNSSAYIEDADGNGAGAPSAQVGTLSLVAGTTYTGTVKFENRLVTPVEDITEEVAAEANAHQVFYTVTGSGLVITRTDVDPNGRPLGLTFTARAATGTASGARTVQVVLCHYDTDPKTANAVTCSGETDIDVAFTMTVP